MRTWMRGVSLRSRLMWLVLLPVGCVWILGAAMAFKAAEREANAMLDAQLAQVGETLMAIVAGGEVEHVAEELNEHLGRYRLRTLFQVWREHDGTTQLLVRSLGAPATLPVSTLGYSEARLDGELWRFHVQSDSHRGYRVVVGQPYRARMGLALEMGQHLVAPVLVVLPLMALLIWVGARRALHPLDKVVREVGAMRPDALRPLQCAPDLPQEVRPLVLAMNVLTSRMAATLEREREFTADAAHELRTPLAALKVQAQVAQRSGDEGERQRALQRVVDGVGRLTHLVSQLLTLARLEPGTRTLEDASGVDLERVASEVCAELHPLATAWGCSLEGSLAPARVATLEPWQAEVLVRNLVDNALRYSAGQVKVACGVEDGRAWLEVLDNGPGITVEERERLRQRFARGAAVRREGAGLGLAIVDRLIELGEGVMEFGPGLETPGPGLGIRVEFAAS